MLSIAICEDNVPVQSQLENYIYELFSSCPVEIFSSGEELLSSLEGKERGFSIYLMDISLPGISGIETAASIRTRDPYALILYITDYMCIRSLRRFPTALSSNLSTRAYFRKHCPTP